MDDTTRIMNTASAWWILVKEAFSKGVRELYNSPFDSSFATRSKRANSPAIAMEARGYRGKGRSQYRQARDGLEKDTLTIL